MRHLAGTTIAVRIETICVVRLHLREHHRLCPQIPVPFRRDCRYRCGRKQQIKCIAFRHEGLIGRTLILVP
jgi:hypothetical protein